MQRVSELPQSIQSSDHK